MPNRVKFFVALVVCAGLIQPNGLSADQVGVRYTEGLLHGFLVLQTLEGKALAVGDLTQTAEGDRVTSKLVLRFNDGSIHEETTVFSQRDKFQVIKYHIVQKGPAFKRPLETSIDVSSGQITVRYAEDDGNEKVLNERLDLPPDVANGMVPTLLKNILPTLPRTTVSIVASTPKPRLVKLAIAPQGQEPFSVGGFNRTATHYVLKVEIGGLAVGRSAVRRRTYLEDRTNLSCLASKVHCGFSEELSGFLLVRHVSFKVSDIRPENDLVTWYAYRVAFDLCRLGVSPPVLRADHPVNEWRN